MFAKKFTNEKGLYDAMHIVKSFLAIKQAIKNAFPKWKRIL